MGYLMILALAGAFPFTPQPRTQPKFVAPFRLNGKQMTVLKPGQACAIPLRNALRRDWGFDNMVKQIPKPPAAQAAAEPKDKMVVPPPAPSCDDAR